MKLCEKVRKLQENNNLVNVVGQMIFLNGGFCVNGLYSYNTYYTPLNNSSSNAEITQN